jgi:apolipoprotein N-acyltransferase
MGVYGVSFAVALTAGLLAAAWLDRRRAFIYLPLAVALWIGGWFAAQPEWVQASGGPLRVALVQANVPLKDKWSVDFRQTIIDQHVSLSERAAGAQLIVWPESAVPGYFDAMKPQFVPRLERLAQERGSDFLVGAVERDLLGRGYYNSVFAVGRTHGSYRKQHLVPFGEFLPWPDVFGRLLATLQIPMSNFSSGAPGQPLLTAAGHTIGVSVCYEDAFGEEVIRALPLATLLVNVSEDSWFGNSLAPHQRLQMARVRALETGRPLLRAANTGPSVIIDRHGAVLAQSPQFAPHVLIGEVQPTAGATPYVLLGNTPLVTLLGVALGAAAWRARRVRAIPR